MKIFVFEADLKKDKEKIIDVLNRNRDYYIDSERYEWLYLNNPAGIAKIWLAKDKDNDKCIGASAALPRIVWVNGRHIKCHVLSDFSIDKEYRSLGPAIKLNRESITPAIKEHVSFSYDFPSKSMAIAHRWLKFEPIGEIVRFVRPLQVKSQLKKIPIVRNKLFSSPVNWVIREVLKIIPPYKADKNYSFESGKIIDNTFDSQFNRLDTDIGPNYVVCGVRNEDYLNWRYCQNPLRNFQIIKVLKDGDLCGYAVFYLHDDNNRILIYDVFCYDIEKLKKSIVNFLVLTARKNNIETIEFPLLKSNPLITTLKTHGFILRPPPADVYAFLSEGNPLNGVVNIAENWYMTMGDRDI